MKAILRQTRISPQKANLVAALIRNKGVNDALEILKFTPKKAADILYKVVASAAANAENNFSQNKDNLFVKEVLVTKGMTFKRSVPISRGRVHPILKRNSHITVKLEARVPEKTEKKAETKKPAAKAEKAAPKKEVKAEKKPAAKTETKKTTTKTTKKTNK